MANHGSHKIHIYGPQRSKWPMMEWPPTFTGSFRANYYRNKIIHVNYFFKCSTPSMLRSVLHSFNAFDYFMC